METKTRASLRENASGNLPIMAVFLVVGALLILVGIAFALTVPAPPWATPTGYILFGLAVISGGIAIGGPMKMWFGYAALLLAIAGAIILIGHYAKFW